LAKQLAAMERGGPALIVLHTDVALQSIPPLAHSHPALKIVVESGPRKIVYFLAELEALLASCPNVFLSTYNVCNWLGLERLCGNGLGKKLLFGSHAPAYAPDAAMGPLVMSRLSWQEKCDIAGNNLRRLLGLPQEPAQEVPFAAPQPFIIDAHGHNLTPGAGSPYDFPAPDEDMRPDEWTDFMDSISVEQLITIPARSLWFDEAGRTGSHVLREHAPGRFRYMEVFDPNHGEERLRMIEASLRDPGCAGIKIHPSFHKTAADEDAYGPVYEMASRHNKPILTHSWEMSAHNPVQELSHPRRFHRHLQRYPRTRLVLGHAGGRPSTFDDVVRLCRDYTRVAVDVAGDYFDSGLIEALISEIGSQKVLFASDVDWIDPRCMLAAVLGSSLSDPDALMLLRDNALRVYG